MLCLFGLELNAQNEKIIKQLEFSGNINLTNNGFSFIPLFSLGKPATTINLSVTGKRFSFDPQLRFDLDGMKPWSLLFGWNYKLVKKNRLLLRVGTSFPVYAFTNLNYIRNSEEVNILTPQRFIILNTLLNYKLSKKINFTLFYINGHGLEKRDQSDQANFVTIRTGVNNLSLSDSIYINFNPEIYFLQIDNNSGFYFANTFALKHKKIPFFISSTLNQSINTSINAKPFDWNIGINYSFRSTYSKKQN